MYVSRDQSLTTLKYAELYERLLDQKSDPTVNQDFFNVLLLCT